MNNVPLEKNISRFDSFLLGKVESFPHPKNYKIKPVLE
jgi:hypothetical protein